MQTRRTIPPMSLPPFPAVPSTLYDWLENNPSPITKAEHIALLVRLHSLLQYFPESQIEDVVHWTRNQSTEQIISLVKGYHVYAEPLYNAIIGDKYVARNKQNSAYQLVDVEDLKYFNKESYTFTEKDIKELDERFWAFRKLVKE